MQKKCFDLAKNAMLGLNESSAEDSGLNSPAKCMILNFRFLPHLVLVNKNNMRQTPIYFWCSCLVSRFQFWALNFDESQTRAGDCGSQSVLKSASASNIGGISFTKKKRCCWPVVFFFISWKCLPFKWFPPIAYRRSFIPARAWMARFVFISCFRAHTSIIGS